MIGSGLKKLAKENQMTVAKGVAYGALRGYAATLSEGSGYKRIDISTHFPDAQSQENLLTEVNQVNIKRIYRVLNLDCQSHLISVTFHDNPGTMKKIHAFLDWFFPLLGQYGARGANCCAECGGDAVGGSWILIDGVAHHMHDSCSAKVKEELAADEQLRQECAAGSYVTGFIGALIGALLGAVVWALVLMGGYVASVVGLLIGFLAEKGYDLLRGKQGKGKIAILIVVIVLGVLAGTFAADVITLVGMINGGELPGIVYGDIPALILYLLAEDSEYLAATLSNCGMGLLFAGLGVFALLRAASKKVSGTKVTDLK